MFCAACGVSAMGETKFCARCGGTLLSIEEIQPVRGAALISSDRPSAPVAVVRQALEKFARLPRLSKAFFSIALVIFIALAVIGGIQRFVIPDHANPYHANVVSQQQIAPRPGEGLPAEPGPTAPQPRDASTSLGSWINDLIGQVVKTEQRRLLEQSPVTVEPLHDKFVGFNITPEMLPATVKGHFTATGGGGNDILVYITDEEGMARVRNHRAATLYYSSRQGKAGAVEVSLNAGRYYLVFENTEKGFSNKVVNHDISLIYH